MIKIIIADDHPIVREGLKKVLEKNPDMTVADEVSTGEELINKARTNDYDVVLLDITMPGRGGLEILEDLKKEKPKLHILVLSIHPEEQYAIRVLKAGASGYLSKDKAPYELLEAIRKVAQGCKYVSASLAEKLAFEIENGREKPIHENLSNREFQVMCMMASGKSTIEIAEKLILSINTIKTYRLRILEKMGMKNAVELTHYVIENGLLD